MPGPAPNPNARRRNARVGVVQLPAAGRPGEPPKWPLPPPALGDVTDYVAERELALWAEVWSTPQAVAWERLGWTVTVARYCRYQVLAEADPKVGAEVRQLEDRLGLTPKSMRSLMWEVAADEVGERREASTPKTRRRLKVVDDDAVAGA